MILSRTRFQSGALLLSAILLIAGPALAHVGGHSSRHGSTPMRASVDDSTRNAPLSGKKHHQGSPSSHAPAPRHGPPYSVQDGKLVSDDDDAGGGFSTHGGELGVAPPSEHGNDRGD